MPRKTVYRAEIEYLQILDETGQLDAELAEDTLSDDDVLALYEQMIINRHLDEAAFKLQRSGRMGTYAQTKGHEAVALGAAKALRPGIDHIVPYYRESPALFLHGLPMHQVLLNWMGDERGNARAPELAINPTCVDIGAHAPHAVGIAWAMKLRKEDRVVLCFFGDGATSTGDVHGALNFASVLKAPVVFCCMNNQWAISVPCCKQTVSQTLAQKAIAYGMPGIQVDGNDLFAVYKAHRDAIQRARAGEGPSLVEALTYRLGDHTTADDAQRYRDPDEYQRALARDPVDRTRRYLESKGLWDQSRQDELDHRAGGIVQSAIETAQSIEPPDPQDVFRYTFERLPYELVRQMQTMRTDSLGQDPEQIGLSPSAPTDAREEARHA